MEHSEYFNILLDTPAIMRGEEEAFNRFYQKYFKRLYHYLLVLTGGREELTRDVLQEAMLRVIRYMKPFEDLNVFTHWLFRLVKTTFIDEMRKRRIVTVPLLPEEEEKWKLEASEESTKILFSFLEEALLTLSPEEQELIQAKYQEEKTHLQMAQERNTTAKAVESRLSRIRKKIRSTILERLRYVSQ